MSERAKPFLVLERRFAASPEKIYRAWTTPEALSRWFGPDTAKFVSAELDVSVGGRYRIVMRLPDGEEARVGGAYREVVENRKLVFTWAWEGTPERESLVTVEIAPEEKGALLILRHEEFFDEAACVHHRDGWTASLDRMERCVS